MQQHSAFSGSYDMHVHTQNSHDSNTPLSELIRAAAENGTICFAVTDHCDVQYRETLDIASVIERSMEEISLAEKNSSITILRGIELGESIWDEAFSREILAAHPYDIVLGSVHAVRYRDFTAPFSRLDFSYMTDRELEEYLHIYFLDMLETLHRIPFDVLTHLTAPLKYIIGRYGRDIDIRKYEAQILEILQFLIHHRIALEVNTGCLDRIYGKLLPDLWIVKAYKALGGSLITLGSDAHTADRLAYGFSNILPLLKETGFTACYRYEQRMPIACPI